MTTLSVPLTDDIHAGMTKAIANGAGSNYADIARKAIKKYLEDLAVQAILDAEKEQPLSGNLEGLLEKI